MVIAISGKSGCGNSTVSRLVAARLNIKIINYTFHDMAREMNLDFKEFCLLSEKDPKYDRYLDKKQVELASDGDCVLGSRLAIWLLKNADLKVYLKGRLEVRAKRIARRESSGFNIALMETYERDKRDRERFIRLYDIDIDKYEFADLIVDTEKGGVKYVADEIIKAFKKR
ncbi:MAG: cytidylate kinase family protein [Spirochaetales bacterium]|nr:cytidylate kinase family protein [Spirochaetales bacterium]